MNNRLHHCHPLPCRRHRRCYRWHCRHRRHRINSSSSLPSSSSSSSSSSMSVLTIVIHCPAVVIIVVDIVRRRHRCHCRHRILLVTPLSSIARALFRIGYLHCLACIPLAGAVCSCWTGPIRRHLLRIVLTMERFGEGIAGQLFRERGFPPPYRYHQLPMYSPHPRPRTPMGAAVPEPHKLWPHRLQPHHTNVPQPLGIQPHHANVPLPLALYLFRSTRGVSTLPKHIVKRIIQFGTPVGTESRLHLPPHRFQ